MDRENRRKMTEGEVKRGNAQTNQLNWEPRVPLFGSDSPSCPTCKSAAEQENPVATGMVNRDAEDMLIKVYRKSIVLTDLYKELCLSGYKGVKTKEELIRAGLVYEVELPTNRRGRRKKLLQVTPKGTGYLRRLGITEIRKGRGGVKHLYYQKALKDFYEEHGYVVEVEATVGDTCLDLLVIRKDGERLGIEIATSTQYEEVNMRKAMEVGLEHFMLVCETEQLMKSLQKRLASLVNSWPGNRPGFKLIKDYLKDD
jgi:DNA-binding MarR family transcriptional regulator